MKDIDFDNLTTYQRYKRMASLTVPRPIALETTLGANGVVNAAPFSMFNMAGENPPLVMLGINRLRDDHLKDTAANILALGRVRAVRVYADREPLYLCRANSVAGRAHWACGHAGLACESA